MAIDGPAATAAAEVWDPLTPPDLVGTHEDFALRGCAATSDDVDRVLRWYSQQLGQSRAAHYDGSSRAHAARSKVPVRSIGTCWEAPLSVQLERKGDKVPAPAPRAEAAAAGQPAAEGAEAAPHRGVFITSTKPRSQSSAGAGRPQARPDADWLLNLAVPGLLDGGVDAGALSEMGELLERLYGRARFAARPDEDAGRAEDVLCPQCQLPIGDGWYFSGEGDTGLRVHAECKAQLVLRETVQDEKERQRKEAEEQHAWRAKYSIGWGRDHIPRNLAVAGKLGCPARPPGMCCLVLGARGLRVAPTPDPAASINLEYLSFVLRVRRCDGREPLFSLDPLPENEAAGAADSSTRGRMQAKRFEPPWLAGTSVGEVMFQADYHLKELSMGRHRQPVVGMKSCLDHLLEEGGSPADWHAREWFVVNEAEILLVASGPDGDALVPSIRMGVEAREQARGENGLEDVPVTRPDHPLVKYAEAFTRYFDLIAERTSVIYHLRELAKASALSKYLLEDGVQLDDSWFDFQPTTEGAICLEIPQAWNDRYFSEIHVRDGEIKGAEWENSTKIYGVYGGVDFGLDRLAGGAVLQRSVTSTTMGGAASGGTADQPAGAGFIMDRVNRIAAARIPARTGRGLQTQAVFGRTIDEERALGQARLKPSIGVLGQTRALGVDLNLDAFDLSAPRQVDARGKYPQPPDMQAVVGGAFWSNLDCGAGSVFEDEDRHFLRLLFNPSLSDRREEGDLFVPPDPSCEYISALRDLVRGEGEVQQRRVEHFLGRGFAAGDAGPLFPSSWASTVGVRSGRALRRMPLGRAPAAEGRRPVGAEAARLERALRSAAPLFDEGTEDGTRFRVFRVGNLEVRSTQAYGGKEVVGVVFSHHARIQAPPAGARPSAIMDEKIVKVTEYVEDARPGDAAAAKPARAGGGRQARAQRPPSSPYRYYVVLETASQDAIVTEKLEDGRVRWEENPEDLEARNTMAKVTGCTNCCGTGITVMSMKACQVDEVRRTGPLAPSPAECRRYVHGLFRQALLARERHWAAVRAPLFGTPEKN